MSDPIPDLPSLRALVGHREFVRADETLEAVHHRFATGHHDFMAVLEGRQLLGLCSRREIGTLLGARYGFAFYARSTAASHLTPHAIRVQAEAPLPDVLHEIALRRDEHFYDDILLVDGRGEFLGLIFVRELVRLQNALLAGNIAELERRQAEIAARNRQMEEDLAMAREVQVALLPHDFPECRSGAGRSLRFAQIFQPAAGVSGDFFDVISVSDHAAGLLMCDVMGHGVRSALVTAMIRAAVEELHPHAANPGEFLRRLNANLTRLLRRTGNLIFVTASYVVVDSEAGRLSFAHAGHPYPLFWSAHRGIAAPLAEAGRIGGPALGLLDDSDYESAQVPMEAGDRIILVTDGILEAADATGNEFGMEELCRVLAGAASQPLRVALEHLRQAAFAHAGSAAGFSDDVCLLGCEIVPGDAGGAEKL